MTPPAPEGLVQRLRDRADTWRGFTTGKLLTEAADALAALSPSPQMTTPQERTALEQASSILGDLDEPLADRVDRAYACIEAAIRASMDAPSPQPEWLMLAQAKAHWFTQGGAAEFGDIGEPESADDLVSAILARVRANKPQPEGWQDIATAQRDLLRAALVRLVGVDTREELEQMEVVMRLMPGPSEDKAATIDAIHALMATLPPALTPPREKETP